MKFTQLSTYLGIILILFACNSGENQLTIINSESFHEKQVQLDGRTLNYLLVDSVLSEQNEAKNQNILSKLSKQNRIVCGFDSKLNGKISGQNLLGKMDF